MTEQVGRLLTYRLGSPAENMAWDEMILHSVDRGGPPTLRFYGWSEPTLSLGYFQSVRDRSLHPESESLVCVRRATGGGAIIHDHELTFSITVPVQDRRLGARAGLYQQSHAAIAETLLRFGVDAVPFGWTAATDVAGAEPFLCFQRRTTEDLVVAGYKVLGSAQRARRGAVLQHGSLLLRSSPSAPQLPGVRELAGSDIAARSLADALTESFAAMLGIDRWREDRVVDDELRQVDSLQQERYANPQWLERR